MLELCKVSGELGSRRLVLWRLLADGLESISGAKFVLPAPPECSKICIFDRKNNGFCKIRGLKSPWGLAGALLPLLALSNVFGWACWSFARSLTTLGLAGWCCGGCGRPVLIAFPGAAPVLPAAPEADC